MKTRAAVRDVLSGMVGSICVAVTLLMIAGCAGRVVPTQRAPHGNLHAELARGAARTHLHQTRPTVVLVEEGGARAIDPESGTQLWYQPLHVVAHPVASADTVYLPLRGHRLAAVDRRSGVLRWSTGLPGEAVTGLAVADGIIIATIVDGSHRSRSRVVAMSTEDAVIRWQRRSDERFGAPATRRRVVVVPLREQVVAFRLSSGREVARVGLPTAQQKQAHDPGLERIVVEHDALLLGGGNRFVNLQTATAGTTAPAQRIDTGHGWLFRPIDGLDPGFDDAERLRLWARFVASGEAPRGAVLLARRAVVAMRLAPDGRPIRARWVHHEQDGREFVAMDVGTRRVTLVREDGSMVILDARDGSVLKRWAGQRRTRGALMVGLSAERGLSPGPAPSAPVVHAQLVALLDDGDPRLLPAKVLATDLLWRSDDLVAREVVRSVATGTRITGTGDTAATLQGHALTLMSGPWGDADSAELQARLAQLSDRPSYLADRSVQLAPIARAAVHSGNAQMVPHLVEHLMHPATGASDLAEVARALATLGGPTATDGLAEFVQRYHADPEVVYESRALHVAVDHLAAQPAEATTTDDDGALNPAATLGAVLRDPFTEPNLRAYIAARLDRADAAAAASDKTPTTVSTDGAGDARDQGRIPPVLSAVHSQGL